MKILYLIQTHQNFSQIKRLINTIKISSPASRILISHDNRLVPLSHEDFKDFSGVDLIYNPGGRGDFFIVQSYLNSLEWVFNNRIDFDWIVNLSGQDYPTHPLPVFERFLSNTEYDGFLEHRDVFSEQGYYGLKESRTRYLYQYWHTGIPLSQWHRAFLKPVKVLVNNSQPFFKIGTSYQLSLGIRDFQNRFDENFKCYGGSFFKILSYRCARYIYDIAKQRADLVEFYKKALVADESFMQTILANSNQFNLCDKNYFYINWKGTKHGRPNILTVAHYSAMTKGEDYYFARKFNPAVDSEILDKLDQHIFSQSELAQV